VTGPLRAGAASLSIAPPLGLPMQGFIRRYQHAAGYGAPLEVSALVLESRGARAVLCGVDTSAIQRPAADRLRARVAAAAGAAPEGVILNWNHTHCAPPGDRGFAPLGLGGGDPTDATLEALAAYIDRMYERVVETAALAASRLEPAGVAWGLGTADLAVNRRERTPEGRVILGWRPDGQVDRSVTALQARRADGSAIATVVSYGCHPVTVGPDVLDYSADYPGPMRDAIRRWTGGEAVFLQGAGGNVLPRVAFAGHDEAARFGRRLALEALHALAERSAGPRRWERRPDGSATPFSLYRFQDDLGDAPVLAAVEENVQFPLMPAPTPEEIGRLRARFESAFEEAERSGGPAQRNIWRYHLVWARRTEAEVRRGTAATHASGPINAVRIGCGAVVTGPGEIFTEIGLAVKERSPAAPTLYAGYANGEVSYFPTAASYPEGGYEPEHGNRPHGLPAPVSPECERILIERAVRNLERVFPERPPYAGESWASSGRQPTLAPEPPQEPPP
jgi:hypothetical protein